MSPSQLSLTKCAFLDLIVLANDKPIYIFSKINLLNKLSTDDNNC